MENQVPYNFEAEKAVLGSILIKQESYFDIEGILQPEDFYSNSHQILFKIMQEMINKSQAIDLVTICNKLNTQEVFTDSFHEAYIASLTAEVPSATNILHYGKIVAENSSKRKLLYASGDIRDSVIKGDDIEVVLDSAEKAIFNISNNMNDEDNLEIISDTAVKAIKKIKHLRKTGEVAGVPVGIDNIDKMLGGLKSTDIIILAARPSAGKSALALNMAQNIALDGKSVLFFSIEMSSEQLTNRMLSSLTGINSNYLQTGGVTDEQINLLNKAVDKVSNAKLYLESSSGLNILKIKSIARKLKRKNNLDIIFIDYLQLINAVKATGNANYDVGQISNGLKQLAKELNVPVVVLSQLSRNVEHRGKNAEPMLADLRDSGSIEQDADIVMFLHRDSSEDGAKGSRVPETKLKIAKNRNGPTGNAYLIFDGATTTFSPLEEHRYKMDNKVDKDDDDDFKF